VELEPQTATSPHGKRFTFSTAETLRQMLLHCMDEAALTVARREEIDRFRTRDRERRARAY
jgi:3-isopropylmalate dehydratase small subunit